MGNQLPTTADRLSIRQRPEGMPVMHQSWDKLLSMQKLYRCRIFHQPWPLKTAKPSTYHTTLIEANGLPAPAGDPLLHHGGPVNVEVWPLEEV
jgi:hypothetical protein